MNWISNFAFYVDKSLTPSDCRCGGMAREMYPCQNTEKIL